MSRTPPVVPIVVAYCARDKDVVLCRWLPGKPPACYVVVVMYRGQVYESSHPMNYDTAWELLEAQVLSPGPGGDSSWNAVLDRLYGRVEPAGQWHDSAAEIASRLFPIGSWPWVQILVAARKQLEVQHNNNNNEVRYEAGDQLGGTH